MHAQLAAQIAFLQECDRLKSGLRATRLNDGSRQENTAEHSWHIALYAMVLADQAGPGVEIDRVIKMLLIHDIVEIDAGDAPIHGDYDPAEYARKEMAAAQRIFGLLPPAQAAAFRALWEEFEAAQTPDAIFAKSIDRVQPVLSNLANNGGSWIDYDVTLDQLDQRIGTKVARGAPQIWAYVRGLVAPWFETRGK
ncbi:MAG: HD domain-containing protein [Paracoccaceae bacterium]